MARQKRLGLPGSGGSSSIKVACRLVGEKDANVDDGEEQHPGEQRKQRGCLLLDAEAAAAACIRQQIGE